MRESIGDIPDENALLDYGLDGMQIQVILVKTMVFWMTVND